MQETNLIILQILLWFIPGIIASQLLNLFLQRVELDKLHFTIESLLFGFFSYTILNIIYIIIGYVSRTNLHLSFLKGTSESISLNYIEILLATFIGIILALFFSYITTNDLIHSIARYFKLTHKSGYSEVWNLLLDTTEKWIIIRDFERDEMYLGNVLSRSEKYEEGELLLSNVTVYINSTAEELYQIEKKYIIFEKSKMCIEVLQDMRINKGD